jgi:hypothetical protein
MPRKVPDGAPDSSLLLASLRCSEGAPIAEKAGHAALALPLWLSDGHNGTGDIAARCWPRSSSLRRLVDGTINGALLGTFVVTLDWRGVRRESG